MNQMITPPNHLDHAFLDLDLIRQHNPLVHNITNLVVMQTTANLLLAIGASPIMAHAQEELAEITAIANSLVINIGTLDEAWIKAIEQGQREALKQSIPIIFDPVGAGASQYRTRVAKKILNNGVHIIRGNPSEIMALTDNNVKAKGVDSCHQSNEAIHAAKSLSNQYQCVVIISGKTDIIIDKNNEAFISYGTHLFTKVTGMGCSATAMMGAFAAINKNYFTAAKHAVTIFTLAGQLAATKCQGPASFLNHLTDMLFSLNKEDINSIVLERPV